ncbi:MAG: SGNH/GDSL hydrolase family protein [Eubacteriales bacterium]
MKRYFSDGARIVVTGDSLSYNRYDYDPVHRLNAFDCFPDMGSWPFRLRDAALTGGCFDYACNLTNTKTTSAPNRIFGDKSVTFTDYADFLFERDTPRITLYLQCLPEGGCFDIYDNGIPVLTDVSFRGNPAFYHGMECFSVSYAADGKCRQEIEFRGSGTGTMLGFSGRDVKVYLTGQGSRRCDFFLGNFYDRIGRFCPSLLVLIIGANDEGSVSHIEFGRNLREVLRLTREVNPESGFVLLTPTDQHDENKPESDESPFFSRASARLFNAEIKNAACEYGGSYVDTDALFERVPLGKWRYDNVHFTRFGSDMLYEYLMRL